MSQAITLLTRQKTFSSYGECPRVPQSWKKIPSPIRTAGKKGWLDDNDFRGYKKKGFFLLMMAPVRFQLFFPPFMRLIPSSLHLYSHICLFSFTFMISLCVSCPPLLEGGRAVGLVQSANALYQKSLSYNCL